MYGVTQQVKRRLRRVLGIVAVSPFDGQTPPAALMRAQGSADEVWCLDLLGHDPADLPALVGEVSNWRTSLDTSAPLRLMVDPAGKRAAAALGVPYVVVADASEARRSTALLGADRIISVRRPHDLGTVAAHVTTVDTADGALQLGPPIFVGGTGRSGTWAMGRMLKAHPTIATVRTEVVFHAAESFAGVLSGQVTAAHFAEEVRSTWFGLTGGPGRPKGLQILVSANELDAALQRFEITAQSNVPRALRQLVRRLLDPFACARGAYRWVETTPANAMAAGTLTRVFPAGRLIHMVRDGRDVAASVATMTWGPSTIREGLEWWGKRMRRIRLGVADADPQRVLTVRLEELVHLDREPTFARVMEFLGIGDPEYVERHFNEHMNSSAGHVGRWRSQVPERERTRIDGRYREILAELAAEGPACLPGDPDQIDEISGGPPA